MTTAPPPIIWSIAGHDSAGGAGLSADQRAADAMGVHLCPVVAALTAQHSGGVEAVFAVPAEQLNAQLSALAQDLPPRAIKTGLLGSVQAIELVARWVDHFRASTPEGQDPHQHLALVVDPVLRASSGGAAFSNDDIVQAYRQHLLPRATVLTPNRAEAVRLLGPVQQDTPALARALQALGARAVLITGGDARQSPVDATHSLDWLLTPHASGWLTAPRVDTRHHHGTGCTLASGVASALALGHVEADACVLGKMLTHHALMHAHAAGLGPGPVMAQAGFARGPAWGGAPLPWLGLGEQLPWQLTHAPDQAGPLFQPYSPPPDGLYGIVDQSPRVEAAVQAGLRCVQLRYKADAQDMSQLASHLAHSLQAAAQAGAQLFINDHWQAALQAPLPPHPAEGFALGLHLGQEDLLSLSPEHMAQLLAERGRIMLGLSSHSLWELARAAGCGASTIACGPVQATTTKDMPWQPQGEVNLRWWVAHSPVPVLAIGGILSPADVTRFARCQPAAVCVVRALGATQQAMHQTVPSLRQAVAAGRAMPEQTDTSLPHPVL